MIDGFWTLQIQGPLGNSGAVAVFIKGKFFGGDSGFSYIGTYLEANKVVQARVQVHHFNSAIQNIVGVDGDFQMDISTTIQGDMMVGTAMISGHPEKSIGIRLIKEADL